MTNISSDVPAESIERLKSTVLFSGVSEKEIESFVKIKKPVLLAVSENETYRLLREHTHMIGLVLEGSANIYSVDYEGNRTLVKLLRRGATSGTLYSTLDFHNTLIEINAQTDCEIMLIHPESVFIFDPKIPEIQHNILVNLIGSQRELFGEIGDHISCLSQRSVRDKILKYLKLVSEREHSYSFAIEFSRDELANYLAVDRASLSRSLGELKREGVIDFRKNEFVILSKSFIQYK